MPTTPNIVTRETYTNQQASPPSNNADGWGFYESESEAPLVANSYAWIAGKLYWCDGDRFIERSSNSASKSKIFAIGDSLTQFSYKGLNNFSTTSLGPSGNDCGIQGLWTTGTGLVTASTAGVIEYSKSLNALRWTAPSDTAGAWVTLTYGPGLYDLESGSTNKGVRVGVRAMDLLTQDRTVTTSISSTLTFGNRSDGYLTPLAQMSRLDRSVPVINAACGSLYASEAVNWIPYYNAAWDGNGLCLVFLGHNDVSGSIAGATIWANVKTVIESQLARGARVCIVGMGARYKINTTVLDAAQLAAILDFNALAQSYANANPQHVRYADTFGRTVDPTAQAANVLTGAPATQVLADHVHHSSRGAWYAAQAVMAAIPDWISSLPPKFADPANALGNIGYMHRTPVTVSASGTGTVSGQQPGGVSTCGAVYVAGDTTTSSVIARDDGLYPPGNFWKQVISGTNTSEYYDSQLPNMSLPGTFNGIALAAGDTVEMECELVFDSLVGLKYDLFLNCVGGAATRAAYASIIDATVTAAVVASGSILLRVPPFKIPSDTTSIRPILRFYSNIATHSGNFKIANWALRKVA